MLTDYHTHLRPDDLDAIAEQYFTEENLVGYLDAAKRVGIEELGFSEHVHRFREALAVWDHPFWKEQAVDDLGAYFDFLMEMRKKGYPVKAGLEVDWVPGRERQLAKIIDQFEWDYILGSVHFLGEYAVDHPEYDIWEHLDGDEIWKRYFDELGRAAASGLFDILSHPDLVKIWGRLPSGDLVSFYGRAIEGIGGSDVAIEVSTAGLRKPVGEIYPSAEFLQMCQQAGRPVALSSDAHSAADIGFGYGDAVDFLRQCGVEEIAVFKRRKRRLMPLGEPYG